MRPPLRVTLMLDGGPALPEVPAFTATELQIDTGSVLHTVSSEGTAVLTRHKRPTFVILTVDRYLQLQQAAAGRPEDR